MNINQMHNVTQLIEVLESSILAHELLSEVYHEILDNYSIEISSSLRSKLDAYFGFDDSE